MSLRREEVFETSARAVHAIDRGENMAERMLVLEAENLRLRQLVAELLVRNQQVRELAGTASQSVDASRSPSGLYAGIKV
ncbi:MAG: hypothetical protein M3Y50_18820 [Acidobacteriota bacterium]|nr:hypothetical protein [Acidobacteriota bacterium]